MALGILGKKLGMKRIFDDEGHSVPVTVVQGGPCVVVQVKTAATDGYTAVQLGFEDRREKGVNKPLAGHFKKATTAPKRYLREFRVSNEEAAELKVGQNVSLDGFAAGDFLDVVGTSKGRGFTGVMKRHNFAGFPATHGTHEVFRHGGSIGGCFPQRVNRGQRMAGHYGVDRVTVQNLPLVKLQAEDNLLYIKGAVPGAKGSLLYINKATKKS